MTRHVLLDNVTHKDLKIITQRGAKYGDNIASVLTFPAEFKDIQTHYPICFSQDPKTQKFHALAIMGFEDNENLFLENHGWDASYIPLMIQRQPFLIGLPKSQRSNGEPTQLQVHLDTHNPRVNTTEGQTVFLPHGGNSDYLQNISAILEAVYNGQEESAMFFEFLLNHELIEAFALEIELDNGTNNTFKGFYTVNEDKLATLPIETLQKIIVNGWLGSIYMVIASMANFRALIARKNHYCSASSITSN